MDGTAGYEGWRWIFSSYPSLGSWQPAPAYILSAVLEGLLTVIAGVASFWLLVRTLNLVFLQQVLY